MFASNASTGGRRGGLPPTSTYTSAADESSAADARAAGQRPARQARRLRLASSSVAVLAEATGAQAAHGQHAKGEDEAKVVLHRVPAAPACRCIVCL